MQYDIEPFGAVARARSCATPKTPPNGNERRRSEQALSADSRQRIGPSLRAGVGISGNCVTGAATLASRWSSEGCAGDSCWCAAWLLQVVVSERFIQWPANDFSATAS